MKKHLLPAIIVLGFPVIVCVCVILASLIQEAK